MTVMSAQETQLFGRTCMCHVPPGARENNNTATLKVWLLSPALPWPSQGDAEQVISVNCVSTWENASALSSKEGDEDRSLSPRAEGSLQVQAKSR